MKLFIVASLIAFGYGAGLGGPGSLPMLGANECTWGPSHWCASFDNAKNCGPGAIEHCIRTKAVGFVGLTKPIPENVAALVHPGKAPRKPVMFDALRALSEKKLGSNCALCEMIAGQIISKLKTNATEEEIIEELEAGCDYLPGSYKDSCKEFVKEYGVEFWTYLVDSTSAEEVCTMFGLCSQEFNDIMEDGKVLAALLSRNVGSIGCDTCDSLMSLVQKETLANKADIEAMLDQICAIIPVDQHTCDDTVNGLYEAAIQLLESYKPNELCQMIGLCPAGFLAPLFAPGPVALGQEGMLGVAAPPAPLLGDGEDPCTKGPGFWCSTPQNIKRCRQEEFCAEYQDDIEPEEIASEEEAADDNDIVF